MSSRRVWRRTRGIAQHELGIDHNLGIGCHRLARRRNQVVADDVSDPLAGNVYGASNISLALKPILAPIMDHISGWR